MLAPRSLSVFAVAAAVLATSAKAGAQPDNVLVVSDDASPGGDGLGWTTAFRTIQEAVDAAAASGGQRTEVWVEAGTYRPTRSFNTTPEGVPVYTLQITGNVRVYGGFGGGEVSVLQRDTTAHPVVIRPVLPDTGTSGVVVRVLGQAMLDGVEIRDLGINQPIARAFNGVGIAQRGTLRNAIVEGTARDGNAALVMASNRATIERSQILGTGSGAGHAGLRINGDVSVIETQITTTSTEGTVGVHVVAGSPVLRRVHLWQCSGIGPMLRSTPGTVMVHGRISLCTNIATDSTLPVAAAGGWLVGVAVLGNESAHAEATVSAARVVNCTILGNAARGVDGGTLGNSIVYYNGRGAEGEQLAGQVSGIAPSSVRYNIIQGWPADASTNVGTAPQLDEIIFPIAGSPAIDTGSNDLVPRGLFHDTLRRPRFAGTATPPGGQGAAPRVDRGAAEFATWQGNRPFCVADMNHDGAVNSEDVARFLALYSIGHPLGDLNGDGTFNSADLVRFQEILRDGCWRLPLP